MFVTQVIPTDPPVLETPKPGFLDAGTDVTANSPVLTPVPYAITAPANPSFSGIADGTVGQPFRMFGQEFYFRVWPLPRIVDVQNPLLDTNIPFQLWNAFLTPNDIDAIIPTDATGLTIDITDLDSLDTLELRTVNVQIHADAPINISALFTFDMQYGGTAVSFIAVLADILPIQPETPVAEKLEWKTDIIQNYDGTEQRIALRPRPRRYFQMSLVLLNDADRKLLYDKLYQVATRELIVPTVQYQSRLKVKTVVADNKIYTNTRRADLRAGEKVVIRTRAGQFYIYTIDEVFPTYVTITTALSQALPVGSIITNAFGTRLPNKSALAMASISGSVNLNLTVVNPRDQVAWPDSGVVVPTFNDKPLLLRNPDASGATSEAFDVGLDIIDNVTGKPQYFTNFVQPFMEGARKYLVQTLFEPDDLEMWRGFLDAIRGQQKSFYTPTYREDLIFYDAGDFLTGSIDVVGAEYPTLYADSESYRQLEIETSIGTYHVKVVAADNNGPFSTLRFATPISDDLTGVEVIRISYLMLVRLANDTVTLTHENAYTTVDLSLRMAVE
jgi:hypothetical protein